MKGRRASGIWGAKSQTSAIAIEGVSDLKEHRFKEQGVNGPRYCTFSSPIKDSGPPWWRLPARARAR